MANYSLVINSKFQPFSFERYMQPLQIYAQLYDQERAAMEQQAAQYGLLSNMVDPELDKEVYDAMQKYNENLMKQRDILSTVGLTPQGRRDLSALRQQYFTDVAPVKTWMEMRNKDIEKQDTLYAQANGNIVFANNPRETSLSYYKKGKPLGLESSNLNAALAESSKAFETWAKTYRDTEEGRAFNNDFITYKQITGINDPNVIYDVLRRSGKYPQFEQIMDTLENRYHANNPNFSDSDRARIKNSLLEGASLGIAAAYDEKTTIQQDPRVKQQMEDESWYYRFNTQLKEDPEKQLKALELQQAINGSTEDPYASLDYFDAPINENVESYGELRNKLYRSDGALKTEYAGNNKSKGFVNPIKVYEYAKDLYDKAPIATKGGYAESRNPRTSGMYPSFNGGESSFAWSNAVDMAKRHFGVNSVITEADYNKLKKLGFDNKSTFKDFQYQNNFDDKVNRTAKRHSATDFNMAKYNQAENKIYPRLSSINYSIHEYDEKTGGFKPGSETRSKKVFKYNEENGQRVKGLNIEGIGYNIAHKGYVILYTSNNKAYYVPISALGDKAVQIEKDAFARYNPQTDEQLGETQNLISLQLREHLNDYDPVASETDSKR